MASLQSNIGRVHLLAKNARIIRDSAFNRLVESVERDPDYLAMRGIIVWQVPQVLPIAEGQKSPFVGQEGKIVVLGGNQRAKALMALGRTSVDARYLIEAKDADGNWVSPDMAERIVLLDNNPEGISGGNDIKKMFDNFSTANMQLTGIDFSAFSELMSEADNKIRESVEDKVEAGEHGEKQKELKDFVENREASRRDLKEIDDAGFHLLLVFESFDVKADFIAKMGLTGENKVVSANGDVYVDLVFESYAQKMEFCEKAGLSGEPPEDGSPALVYGLFADGRALAKRFGIELKESGLHFRDTRTDSNLSELAREETPQLTEEEQQERIYREAKAERA